MKIAFVVGPFPKTSETFILNQMTGLLDRGHDLDIYASERQPFDALHGDMIRYGLIERTVFLREGAKSTAMRCAHVLARAALLLPRTGMRPYLRLLRARPKVPFPLRHAHEMQKLGCRSYDIIHCQFGTIGSRIQVLRELGAISGRLVVSFRGFDATRKVNQGLDYSELFRKGDLFLPVCDSIARLLIHLGCPREKIRVHRSGISLKAFPYSGRYRMKGEPTRLVSVARLTEKKGLRFAVDAVAEAVRQGRRISYSIIGDGEEREALERQIARLGLDGHISLLGWRSREEVVGILGGSHILVAPSITASTGDQEGIPNALKEGMAMGLPVLSTVHGGIPELVQDGVSGFLVPEGDARALAEKLCLLAESPGLWQKMGQSGRARIEAEYDTDVLNDRLVGLYGNLLTTPAALAV
jgi:colanic acid/amylovoran biosynthesis glycosyltransferase